MEREREGCFAAIPGKQVINLCNTEILVAIEVVLVLALKFDNLRCENVSRMCYSGAIFY